MTVDPNVETELELTPEDLGPSYMYCPNSWEGGWEGGLGIRLSPMKWL